MAYDVAFVVDSSSSMTEENFRLVLAFVSAMVMGMNVDTGHVRISLMSYRYVEVNSFNFWGEGGGLFVFRRLHQRH